MTAIRITVSSLLTAIRHPRVWLTLWLVIALVSAVCTYPFARYVDARLAHHPGASRLVDQALDVDLARMHERLAPDLTMATVLMLLVMTLFGGGILATVGNGRKFRYTDFLTKGGYFFTRCLRALLVFALPLFITSQVIHFLGSWLRVDVLRNTSAGGTGTLSQWFNLEFSLFLFELVLALGFYIVVFAYKVARARLVLGDRRSVLLAWGYTVGKIAASPLRVGLIVAAFLVLNLAVTTALGALTTRYFEVRDDLCAGAIVGQLSMMWLAILATAQLIAARRFLEFEPVES